MGAPYLRSPLGEGRPPDPDPRVRLDAFDCTTFVETAIALGRVGRLETLETELDRLRYAALPPRFEVRRHLMASQWVPELVEAGVLEDVTRALGGRATLRVELALGPRRWSARRIARGLELSPERVPEGRFALDVLPLPAAAARQARFPPGTVLNLVRVAWVESPELVTHQGLIVQPAQGGRLVVRHASPVARRVVDEPLDRMIARYRAAKKRWPIAGINLLRVVPPDAGPSRRPYPR